MNAISDLYLHTFALCRDYEWIKHVQASLLKTPIPKGVIQIEEHFH